MFEYLYSSLKKNTFIRSEYMLILLIISLLFKFDFVHAQNQTYKNQQDSIYAYQYLQIAQKLTRESAASEANNLA